MPLKNREIVEIFNETADLLELEGADEFRVRAYRSAARTVESLTRNVADMVAQGEELTQLPGIGKELSKKIGEIAARGELTQLKELRSRIPRDLVRMTAIEGLGPKGVQLLRRQLNIESLEELREAALQGKIREISRFGVKREKKILEGLEKLSGKKERFLLNQVEESAEALCDRLNAVNGVKKVAVAGSYRRCRETVGDLDILVTCGKGFKDGVMDAFVQHEDVAEIVSRGKTRSTVMLRSGLQVDLRVVPQVSYGAAMHYFTGSRSHNIAVRRLAAQKGFKVNEYGVFKGRERVAGSSEEEVFRKLGLPYVEPELRENRGEMEAAQKGTLPRLITLGDVRGDLHIHTKTTDGRNTLEEMAEAARQRGYEYLAITNHSQKVAIARGLDVKGLRRELEEIDRFNDRVKGIRVLKGIEVDILEDGTLDLPDEVLQDLDLTICSVHYQHNMSRAQMTERILRAMDNPFFHILGHPTGRLIGRRDAYEVDMDKVLETAGKYGCFVELNAQPDRLDLTDIYCLRARELGVKTAISTDAHSRAQLDYMRFGIGQARRGWLEAKDVLNTRPWKQLRKILRRR